ncbi:hypothetical protein [Spirosoma utsteinense]|uniref:Outer membrane protein beta-barrel domain-containing protein n=1 Tax=Spirosoma utsteinense TaxID=2585773 RepID=A0ABR6W6I9_9BACT|nr:hypothetical protein [Spirosoma utsteinense]MBC3785367.1 hypothetical protein [Spirosoma utsteinense]MBC3791606.1 hypothetical protein [Spirosoma utsteinense]
MQDPTDDQLDGLFRKSAEEFDAPFDPAAWQALKSRLDRHDRFTIWEHILRWGIPVLLLLLLTVGSWNAHRIQAKTGQVNSLGITLPGSVLLPAPANKTAETDRLATSFPVPAVTDRPARTRPVAEPHKPARPAQADIAGPAGSTLSVRSDNELRSSAATTTPTGRKNSRVVVPELTGQTNRPARSAVSTDPANPIKDAARPLATASVRIQERNERPRSGINKRKRSRPLPGTPLVSAFSMEDDATKSAQSFSKRPVTLERAGKPETSQSQTSPADGQPDVVKPVVLLSFNKLTSQPGQWPRPLLFRGRAIEAPVREPAAEPQSLAKPVSSTKGLSIRFLISPDLSGIGLRNIQRPGTNVGLMLDYRLAPRWSVQAGLLRSTKVYKALPDDYDWPKAWPVIPESVDGRCNMLDISINIRYDVVLRPRSDGRLPDRWFVSGGATTYYIRQEDYVYNYPAHTYNVPKGWKGRTGWNGFSQLNLSGGFERSFSRRLSWQVEPFVKVPLKGVGYFKIDLLSTGAFFSLRYKL